MEHITVDAEHKNIESFVQYCYDEEKTSYDHNDLTVLCYSLRKSQKVVREELLSYGLTLAPRTPLRTVRGFSTSSHDRWYGPGSTPTYGGCGIDSATGRATVRGNI
jgi:hypothetical protein